MSGQDVEVVRAIFDRFAEQDLEGFLELVAKDVEWLSASVREEGREPFRGHEGIRAWFAEAEAAHGYTVAPLHFQAGSPEGVVYVSAFVTIFRAGGGRLRENPWAHYVFELRDGVVVRLRTYFDEAEALSAAGLSDRAG